MVCLAVDETEGVVRMKRVVVYAGTRNLYETMKTAVTSLLANNKVDTVYLLIEDNVFPYELPEGVKAINVCNQRFFPETGANYHCKWSYMSMIRVALGKMFPREKRMLWLDCDTIVDGDISELFEMNMIGYYFAGVKEHNKKNWIGDYINTGVLVMNLEAIRRDKIDDRIIALLNKRKLDCPDQDAINLLAKGKILFLSSEYNVCPFTEPPERQKIIHYAARYVFDNDPLYRKYSGQIKPPKTLIAIPCFDMVHADFMKCMLELEKDADTSFAIIKNSLIYNARNMIAENAIRFGFDRVLWLDSDMTFAPDTLKRLIADMDGRDFVSALYFMRTTPTKPVVYSDIWYRVNANEATAGATNVTDYPEGIFEIAGSGFGCVMTSVLMLKTLVERYGAPFTPMMGLGEDMAFCWRATQNGFRLFCDSRIKCGHIGQTVFDEGTCKGNE